MLDRLPTELLDLLVCELEPHALRSVVLTAKRLSELFNETLLKKGMGDEGAPIIWAARHGDVELATRILDLDEKQRGTTGIQWRWTKAYQDALLKAADEGQEEILTLLLQRLPDLGLNSIKDGYERSAMWYASLGGHAGALRVLATSGRIDINGADYAGKTALRMAVEYHHPEAVRALLALGADARVADHHYATPVIVAAGLGHVDLLELFAAHDRDLCLAGNARGFTPLLAAATRGRVDAVRTLAGYGADLCAAWEGLTPLVRAVLAEAPDLIEFLLAQPGVAKELNDFSTDGSTPLMAPTLTRALVWTERQCDELKKYALILDMLSE